MAMIFVHDADKHIDIQQKHVLIKLNRFMEINMIAKM